ncbi:sensor histidine kinase [Streptococcus infantis]|uniref:sensor histidine kinase n=1 Tax=Streptococcus infantis TaxID=68892 RepID=UPI0020C8443F|nr:sensor histidine kinase [Streptococcus infantis]MCP9056864.1 ATP-binding protein [Streptococcus infantis]MCP9081266.1 ATP-binding protein [Streptococcus infantis]
MNKKEVNLTIDSRIISHLGEALIDNEKIALLELIKNSSDADANYCNIEIDTLYQSEHGQGRIIIEDDGNGMTPYIIENAFLKIATSFKSNHQKVSPKFKRQAQGNKGIGRLSLNQLGKFISVDTKVDLELPKYFSTEELQTVLGYDTENNFLNDNDFYYYHIEIDWERYSKSNEPIEDVKLDLQALPFNEFTFNHKKNHGTRIEVLGLKGIDFWQSTQTQKEIEQDVLEFLNPYLDEKYNFYVKINLDNRIFTSNKYDISDIENNFLSKVDFTFNSNEKIITLNISRSKKYIDYKVKQLISELRNWELEKENEPPYKKYYNKWMEEKIYIDLSSLTQANVSLPNVKFGKFLTYSEEVKDEKHKSKKQIEKFFLPGDFRGTIYGFDLSPTSPVSKTFRNVLEEIKGVKIYRNNFRIFPYGSSNNDWLGMSDYNLRNKGVIFKQHTSTGFFNIDGEQNLALLKELTNRQGLVLDNFGTNFILIAKDLIYKTIANRDKDLSQYFNFKRKEISDLLENQTIEIAGISFKKQANDIIQTENKAERLVKEFDNMDDNEKKNELISLKESTKNLRNAVNLKEKQVEELVTHIDEFAPIMGATIIAETLSHEIIRLSNNIKFSSSKVRNSVLNNNEEEAILNLNRIDSSNKFLVRYASLLDVNSYSRRRRYSVESIKEKLEEILENTPLLTYGNTTVNLKIIGNDFKAKIISDSFKIIIENLVINSTYWLDKMNISDSLLTFKLDNDLGKLFVFDNGIGIDKSVENHLFEEFVTNKPDNDGRGMGLYIVTTLLNEFGATITLDDERNQYGNLYKFIITFPDEEV